MHGKCGATYESGSLRRYHLGRTETIRSCTLEAQLFARAMSEQHNETANNTKYDLFLNAMKAHRQYTNDAINAKGIDRHLLGLRLIAMENNLPKPALYNHISYKRAMHFNLSTSQVAAKHDCVMVYGAAVDDGYGCCYNPRRDSINYMITAFKINNGRTNVQCWYMDDRQDDPQDNHLLKDIDTAALCDRTGVQVWQFQADQILVNNDCPSLLKLKQDRGYTYEDEITIEPSMEKYDEKLKMFRIEHIHSDEEIRLVLEGSGFFDVRDCDDKWVRIHVFPGDLLMIPAGMYHRFVPDKQNFIYARRFFVGEPVWTPINRPIGDTHPSRMAYIKSINHKD
ncbi:unnamed protein product [Rotaria sp. Silwood2]|nr:unnamed protein product [Rotaria sp. Silwood2]